jgi:hypothetical protein
VTTTAQAIAALNAYLDTGDKAHLARGVELAELLGVRVRGTVTLGWWPEDVVDLIDSVERASGGRQP